MIKIIYCAHVSKAIFDVNLSVLFCKQMEKSLNIKKLLQHTLTTLHVQHEVFFCSRLNISVTMG